MRLPQESLPLLIVIVQAVGSFTEAECNVLLKTFKKFVTSCEGNLNYLEANVQKLKEKYATVIIMLLKALEISTNALCAALVNAATVRMSRFHLRRSH